MKKTSNKLYIIILVVSTIIFCIGMSFIYSLYKNAYASYEYTTLSSRLEFLEDNQEYGDLELLWQTLYYDHNIEPEFDAYWNLAQVEQYYLQGLSLKRAIDEGDYSAVEKVKTCISFIEEYIENENNIIRQNIAKDYLKTLNTDLPTVMVITPAD